MKICPKCQQQFPTGFQYCPNDTEMLLTGEEYVRQTKSRPTAPVAAPVAAPVIPPVTESRPTAAEEIPAPKPATQPPSRPTPRPAPASGPLRGEVPLPPTRVTETISRASEPRVTPGQTAPTLNFSVPDQGSLVSRLVAGLKNIGELFKSVPAVSPGAAGDFKFLLPEEPLVRRIGGEIATAAAEFRRSPRQFVVDFVKGEGTNRYRRNALLAGSEMAFVGLITIFFISLSISTGAKQTSLPLKIAFFGFAAFLGICYLIRGFLLYRLISQATRQFGISKVALEFANWTPLVAVLLLAVFLANYNFYCLIFPDRCNPPEVAQIIDEPLIPITDIAKLDIKVKESPKAKEKSFGGSKPKPKPAGGGGGGGKQQPTPPSKGVPPQMALTPPIMPPDPTPPKIKNPSLIVAQNIYGDPKALPALKGPIGDPTGVPAPPSSGPGKGDGIGKGTGQGVGVGDGGGLGAGRGGNVGGGDPNFGGGAGIQPMSNALKPTILYKEKAKYTEEARQNKIQGVVTLSVVFGSDGVVSQIRVVRGLPDGLTEKAIEAAKKIRFQPAVKNGSPVSVRGNLEFTFNLY